ncbi:glycolipid transfer protein-like isoform X1 [Scleropages formosus]|uniref:glycolipid transfer protein-like isoform X1 n=1 Tax=Scleropages formosus TaxID=113540 RepID=UPI0008787EC2|nr:glycolipid transfer protein-like isoform X1 [Scleropages formosus]
MALLMDHQFTELRADGQVDTKSFLESVSYLPPFFDCLGSKVFAPIKADIAGNVTKIKAVYDTDPARYETLQQILEVEKEVHPKEWPKVGATLALMWLKRGLRFIQIMLQSLVDGEKDDKNPNLIRVNATKAYETALKRYHGWLVQNLFKEVDGGGKVYEKEQHCMLHRIRQISSKPCPKVRRSRRKTACSRSNNSWSILQPLWMPFTPCSTQ